MTMPVYVSPEQVMKDRADFARKGIARGRSVIVMSYQNGILLATENHSRALHKISEIYDRIGFAAVGKYNEFEQLRVGGIRYADTRGYNYSRADVTARALANAYAQAMGTSFTTEQKPLEVELIVAEIGAEPDEDQIYRVSYDGSVAEEPDYLVIGGQAETLNKHVAANWRPDATLPEALKLALDTLGSVGADGTVLPAGEQREIEPKSLEVGVLERHREGRTFRRITGAALTKTLADLPKD